MKKILLICLPLVLSACVGGQPYIPYGGTSTNYYPSGHYQQHPQSGQNYQRLYNNNQRHNDYEGNYNEHHDNGKHKGQHKNKNKNKHHDD